MILKNIVKGLIDSIKVIVFVGIIAFLLLFVISFQNVSNDYMEPNLSNNDVVLIEKVSYYFNDIKRKDIVSIYYKDPKHFIARVIGLPGEKIEYKGHKLYVNDEYVDEFFLSKDVTEDFLYEKIPDDKYLVMSDNRTYSFDSRNEDVGLISKSDIVGKVFFRFWPINKLGPLK